MPRRTMDDILVSAMLKQTNQALSQSKDAIERLLTERRDLQVERDHLRDEVREARNEAERLYARAEQAEDFERRASALEQEILRRGWWMESGAPCALCGYEGPGYYQPETHDCARKAAELEVTP